MESLSIENFAPKIIGKVITDIVKIDDCTLEVDFNSKYKLILYDAECSFGVGGGFGEYPIELSKNVGLEIKDVKIGGNCLMTLVFENEEKTCIPWSVYEARIKE